MAYPFSAAPAANTYFINKKTGNNTRNGLTALLALSTLTAGIAKAGEIYLYLTGFFNEGAITTAHAADRVYIYGDGDTIIDGTGKAYFSNNIVYLYFYNLIFQNFTTRTIYATGTGNANAFTNCIINNLNFNTGELAVNNQAFISCFVNISKRSNYTTSYMYGSGSTFVNGTAAGEEVLLHENALNKNNVYYNQRILLGAATPTAALNLWFDPNCLWSIPGVSGGAYIAYADKTALQAAWTASTLTGTKTIPATWQVGAILPRNASINDYTPLNTALATASDTNSYVGYFNPNSFGMTVYADIVGKVNTLDNYTKTGLTIANNLAQLTSSTVNGSVYGTVEGTSLLKRLRNQYAFLQHGATTKEYVNAYNQVATAATLFADLVNTNDYKISAILTIKKGATYDLTAGNLASGQKYVVLVNGGAANWSNLYATATDGNNVGSVFTCNLSAAPTSWGADGKLARLSDYIANSVYRFETADTEFSGTPSYYLITEARNSVKMRWRTTNLAAVAEIGTGVTLNVGSTYLMTSGASCLFNGVVYSIGESFTVLAGMIATFFSINGAKVKEVFTAADLFYYFDMNDEIQCITTDNAAPNINKSNIYRTTGDPDYYTLKTAGAKTEYYINATYVQKLFSILQSQI